MKSLLSLLFQLLHTIEQIGEAIDPTEREGPGAQVLDRFMTDEERRALHEIYANYRGLKPSHVKQYNREEEAASQPPHRVRENDTSLSLHITT